MTSPTSTTDSSIHSLGRDGTDRGGTTSAPMIVLVDDDWDKQFLLKRLLHKHFPETRITAVTSCADALPLVRSPNSKIVVTNGRMRGKDRVDFAHYVIRENHAPVIIISLHRELEQRALAAGAFAFVETGDDNAIRDAVARALTAVSASP